MLPPYMELLILIAGFSIGFSLLFLGIRNIITSGKPSPWKLLICGMIFALLYILFSMGLFNIVLEAAILAGRDAGMECLVMGFLGGWVFFLALWIINCLILAIQESVTPPKLSTEREEEP